MHLIGFLFSVIFVFLIIGLFRILTAVKTFFRGGYVQQNNPRPEGEITIQGKARRNKKRRTPSDDEEFVALDDWEKIQGIEDAEIEE